MTAALVLPHGTDVPSLESIYQQHATFVALALRRFGVRPTDVEDLAHEVFLIVHGRLTSFDGTSLVTTWLFGICRRVAANYRRRQQPSALSRADEAWKEQSTQAPPDEILTRVEELAIARRILSRLQAANRHVFVMFELETLTCPEIAEIVNIPIGTVYSRLFNARKQIEKIVADIGAG